MQKQVFIFLGEPMGAPRMTRADAWAKRPCVLRYFAYKDKMREACAGINQDAITVSWTAYLPMPDSWPAKKKAQMCGMPHRQKPDRDNIDKGILDALFDQDKGVAHGEIGKRWDDGFGPRIEITVE